MVTQTDWIMQTHTKMVHRAVTERAEVAWHTAWAMIVFKGPHPSPWGVTSSRRPAVQAHTILCGGSGSTPQVLPPPAAAVVPCPAPRLPPASGSRGVSCS